ncbi:hypothetical protein HMN09_00233300 [Mycena chlorophos]|uniref:Cytochrome P450 n=1 Tax=Mycena chlorophos TaxID=658473 RepID=A0A8H6THT1_MYCCL|nr:hypothetical protein HMN09_00233300 [Mycena chlorophos]
MTSPAASLAAVLQEVRPASAIAAVLGVYAVLHAIDVFKLIRTTSHFPRILTLCQPLALPGVLLPTTSWSIGYSWHWVRRFQTYAQSETVELIPLISGYTNLWTNNVDIARQVVVGSHRSKFFKPEMSSQALLLWGMNLVGADGATWRKHRRVVGPAFNVDLYKLVWKQSRDTFNEFMNVDGWDRDGRRFVEVGRIQDITFKFAFLIIINCGFGVPSTWYAQSAAPPSSKSGGMSVQEALSLTAEHHLLMLTLPKWMYHLPIPKLRRLRTAREKMMSFMREQIAERKAEVTSGNELRPDAFTMLVKANQDEEEKNSLDEDELIGNVFLFMFAGHETTAHTLAAALGFLAIHPEIQDEVVAQIVEVVDPERDPVFEDYGKLDKVLATFYEAARMFPAGHVMIREATEDTVLQIPNPVGSFFAFLSTAHVLNWQQIVVDMVGLQHNPRYFDKPEEYRPSRWYGLPADSEQFTAFSIGPRACLGRRFATVEATCFLTMLLRDWRVKPLLEEKETVQSWKARVMEARLGLTLGARDIPLRFERRNARP